MGTDTRKKGFPLEDSNNVREIVGTGEHEVIDCSSDDAVPARIDNCRYFMVDVEGIVKFDYKDNWGTTRTRVMNCLPGINQWRNIVKVYQYYVDTTSCTAQSYSDAGALVTGITLCR